MNAFAVRNKRIIVSVVMALMMVLAMMPSMAFAQSIVAGYDVTITGPQTVLTGTNPEMSASIIQPENTVVHIDWSSSNTNIATVSNHKGKITPKAEGSTTITATLREGAAPTGDGSGTGGNCTTTILATATIDVTVQTSTAYGYQGTGGNTMKMLTPSTITGGPLTAAGYYNVIPGGVTLNNGSCDFVFTMSAGVNNFQINKFRQNSLPHITVLDLDYQPVSGVTVTAPDNCFDATTKGITIHISDLVAGNTYILEFGPNVCGNNVDKKLGVPVDFEFQAK